MLYYFPLENYVERFSHQLSAPKTGWMERNFIRYGIQYERIEGTDPEEHPNHIRTGKVLGAIDRPLHCLRQVERILKYLPVINDYAERDKVDPVFYFDDFWHPGIEAIRYACDVAGYRKPRIFSNLWAQSVDEYDFTYPMRYWMRNFEKGNASLMEGIFVACPTLKHLVTRGMNAISNRDKVFAIGHPWDTEEVHSKMNFGNERKKQVVFASRWDTEKDPLFFLQVAKETFRHDPSIQFVICTSRPQITSDSEMLLEELRTALQSEDFNLSLKENLTKEQYYDTLTESAVLFNCSNQDWISYVLLEGSAAGCYPLCPHFRAFPEVLLGNQSYMYTKGSVSSAVKKIVGVCSRIDHFFTTTAIEGRSWIHERFDSSIYRMLYIMGLVHHYDPSMLNDPFTKANIK